MRMILILLLTILIACSSCETFKGSVSYQTSDQTIELNYGQYDAHEAINNAKSTNKQILIVDENGAVEKVIKD